MHPQLLDIREELAASSDRFWLLVERASDEQWMTRPSAESWSASECVQHLNATSTAMVPLIRERLGTSGRLTKTPRYRFNPVGWMIWRASSPGGRVKVKTAAPFVPASSKRKKEDLVEWAVCQSDVLDALEHADGFPLNRLKIVSPFNERVRYNVYAAFRILATHQQRHLDQAENALASLR